MPRGKQGPEDVNEAAFRVLRSATRETTDRSEKNPAAVSLGRLGGLRGGKARADKLTAGQRTEIAKKAAAARWGKSQ